MQTWRAIQKSNFRKLDDLLDFLQIPEDQRVLFSNCQNFSLNLPRRLADKIEKGSLTDPLLRQFLPSIEEQRITEGFSLHPVDDQRFVKNCRLLQKYAGRALLVTTGACAMHCRYCFRQNFDYGGDPAFLSELAAIEADPTIEEVILSGGDPLSLSNERLFDLIQALAKIPHVKLLRFHSRFLIGIPERIDDDFLSLLKKSRFQVVFVIHCNHARELDDDVANAIRRLRDAGALLLNQSVLLKGINDDAEILKALSLRLLACGVLPYYLHQLDRVQGSAHFEVPMSRGLQLIDALKKCLPGYGVPRYVCEIPGESGKSAITYESKFLDRESQALFS